ncbi:hypothetical protein ACFWBF_13230, partial [Streptomyces sp. NPDC060028]
MSDFVDRVLGVPDPAAVRPRIPSFFDLPPVLDPPPPGMDAERDAGAPRPPAGRAEPWPDTGRGGQGPAAAPAP